MESTPRRLATRASWLITQTAVHSRRLVAEGFTAAGARGYHYRVLAALHEFGPASQADLGRRCQMDRSDVVAAVTELERAGFVARGTDPADRRRNTVTISDTGERQLHQLDDALDQVQDDLLAPLTPAERQTLITLLGKVLDHHSTPPTAGDQQQNVT
ncbi:MarR family winged helix-turn-helix transcriptional regulator [Micromonospora sp. NBC_01813]|uniref:MarR family winged helix-turn-helix transcriptional regulator n=1 Tax=Micromonospora sp. NBC_01813 TaxID=2975988 RepID=UPI002DDACACD|nr:MarR family transcriptional regulator [Micromonospora sp. NBC_01813]WSA11766.1 MarR family transcriptional regulator [Micromonospora sp. NBC_01813]